MGNIFSRTKRRKGYKDGGRVSAGLGSIRTADIDEMETGGKAAKAAAKNNAGRGKRETKDERKRRETKEFGSKWQEKYARNKQQQLKKSIPLIGKWETDEQP